SQNPNGNRRKIIPKFLENFWTVLSRFLKNQNMDYKDRLIQQAMEQDKGQMRHPLSTSLSRYSVPSSYSQDLRREVLIEMEKEKIIEELMIYEIARKRVLEAELRSELLRWVPPMGKSGNGAFLEERVRMVVDEAKKENGRTGGLRIPEVKPVCREGSKGKKLIILGKPDVNVSGLKGKEVKADNSNVRFQTLPFVSYADLGVSSEIKPVHSGLDEKQNVKGKVDENITGLKRKSVSPPAQVTGGIWNKKPKADWHCSTCNVNCTGQQSFDAHLQGRRHKVKEKAALRGNKAGKNLCIDFPKKAEDEMRVAEIEDIAEIENEGLINYGAIVPYVEPPAPDADVENFLTAEGENIVETNGERAVAGGGELENITEIAPDIGALWQNLPLLINEAYVDADKRKKCPCYEGKMK
ncbi:zinc finger RNA-binding protein, partial [Striga asiatica]